MESPSGQSAPVVPPRPFRLSDPPRWVEVVAWLVVIASVVGMRLYLAHLLPVGVWSKDAGSYAYSAFRWIHTGHWETDPRRGPVYSMVIALCGKLWGDIDSLMVLQHVLGAFSILLAVFCLRLLHGRAAVIPLALCGYAYGMYALPLYLEQLVRNETMLFFFGSVSLAAWLFSIHWKQPHWLWITGAAAALLAVTKNVWLPFPLIFVGATLWYSRAEMRRALLQVVIFVVAFTVPYIAAKEFKQHTLPAAHAIEPQDGILLYGRTAQFTRLDGGIYPEIKAQIRTEVETYQHEVFGDGTKAPRLHNNKILKDKESVVPHLRRILAAQGKDAVALNALCRALALEAIRTHPFQYGQQVGRDLLHMHVTSGMHFKSPDDSDIDSLRDLLQGLDHPDPIVQMPRTVATLDRIQDPKRFNAYHRWIMSAWLFDLAPVLLTTLLWPLAFFLSPAPMRAWWLGAGGIWYFTMVLLATVGRPLDRYLIPALPIMFWTLGNAVILLWLWAVRRIEARRAL